MNPEWPGYFFAAGAAVTWALAPVIYRRFIDHFSYIAVNVVRCIGYLTSAGLYLYVTAGAEAFRLPDDPHLLVAAMGVGIIWFVLGDMLWFASLHRLGASFSTTIFSAFPLLAVPAAWLVLGQRPTLGVVLAALLIVSGLLALNVQSYKPPVGTVNSGLLFALATMGCGLVGTLSNAYFVQHMSVAQLEWWRAVAVTIVSWGIFLGKEGVEPLKRASTKSLAGLICAGSLSLTVGNLFWSYGLCYVAVGVATCISATKPFLTALFATLFLGERVTRRTLGGMALVVSGVIAMSL